MNAPDRENLDTLLTHFEELLELEGECIRKADTTRLETCHLRKENSMAAIRAALGIKKRSLGEDDFEKRGALAGEKYRRIVNRLKENLDAAEAFRDVVRKQINRFDRPSTEVRTYSKLEQEAEAINVDVSY